MPELGPLPRRPRAPVLQPRDGDYLGVVDRARHRRRRHLGATGAGVAGAAAVLAFAISHGGGTYGLQPVSPPAGVGRQVHGDPTAPPESPNSDPGPASPSATADAGRDGGSAGPGEATDPGDVAGPVPGEPGGTAAPPHVRPVVVRDDVADDPTSVCDTDPSIVTATGWCLRYVGPRTIRTGSTHTYRVLACRSVGRGTATLTFSTEQQVDFRVYTPYRTEWHWSQDYPFPKRESTVTVADSRCARWSVTWDSVGDDGDAVPPGSYTFSPDVLVSDWGTGGAMSVGTAYTFTIEE